MDIHNGGSMDSDTLHILRCQFLYHIFNCKECSKCGLLPEHLCQDAHNMQEQIYIFSDMEEDYRRDYENVNFSEEAQRKQMISALISFWPGTN